MRFRGHIHGDGFSPRSVAGLGLWLDAADPRTLFQDSAMTTPASDGSPVGAWLDKSGNARHLLQSIATKRPGFASAAFSGRPCVRADGVDDRMGAAGWSLGQPDTLFVVGKYDQVAANQGLIDGAASPGRHFLFLSGSPPRYVLNAGTSLASTTNADANPHLHTVVVNGSSTVYRLGGATIAAGNPGSDSLNGLTLLGSYFGSGYAGAIGEVLIYNRVLSDSQMRAIEAHLQRKWGLQ